MRRILTTILLSLLTSFIYAQQYPKREFRAAWIATVSNIDWPSKRGLPAEQQKAEFIARLDQLKALGCNAVIVQVRPAADAFYASLQEPWSRYLTGKQGKAPFPYYDPLSFMIEEAHKRHMELHAWFNPFRVLTDSRTNPNPSTHVSKQHPDWVVNYGNKGYLNPGIPKARAYVIDIILDVVKRYDIDGVHLDDYFYPYRIAGKTFYDQAAFNKYKSQFTDKEEWRRDNVNQFVAELNTKIKQLKPYVKFGISPFGIWRNASKDPRGSNTKGGQTCYDDLYSDILLWMQEGWVDYILPQLYWEHGHRAAAFEVLLPWWEQQPKNNVHLYYGLGLYRMINPKNPIWQGTKELLWQMQDIRSTQTPGVVLYSTSNFDKIPNAIQDSIKKRYQYPAFPPRMKWLDSIPPVAPALSYASTPQGISLKWDTKTIDNEPIKYIIYRFTNGEPANLSYTENIIAVISGKGEFLDNSAYNYDQCAYFITVMDRL
ncbi:MAG: family 10 glycosylhydrolase [Flavipsychrobacter sp.]